jgi:hypothetical protein
MTTRQGLADLATKLTKIAVGVGDGSSSAKKSFNELVVANPKHTEAINQGKSSRGGHALTDIRMCLAFWQGTREALHQRSNQQATQAGTAVRNKKI